MTTPLARELLGPALVVAATVTLELVDRLVVRVPNPPALLVIFVVFSAFHGGTRSGLASALLAWAYFTWAFSVPGHLFQYAPDDLKRVIVWAVAVPVMAVMVGSLKTRAVAAERAASREAEERFTKAFHASPVGVVLSRLSDDVVLDANDVILEITGFARGELVGKRGSELRLWQPPVALAEIVAKLRAGGTVSNLDVELRKKSGKTASLLCSMERVTVGADECMLTFAVDVTERKRADQALRRAEEQLLQTQKMEAVGRLAGGIAHDFNNLLTIIGGNASLLAHTLKDGKSHEIVEEISHAAERAATLTRQLLAFGRSAPREPRAIDLGMVIANLEPFLARTIGERVVLSVVLAPSLGAVRADPGQIDQVITNLVINARDAMPDGGTLTVETREANITEAEAEHLAPAGAQVRAGRFVALAVRDTGEGMDEATVERIFEPFFTTKGNGRGTGLGLATVYGIVARAGGFITVDSAPGKGAAFEVYLPRVDEEVATPVGPEPERALPRGTERLLLVEDDAAVRTLTARLLRELGYAVIVAVDAADALAIATRSGAAIDLVVTDIVMPDMNGRELAERLAPLLPGAKVLFCSGYADDQPLAKRILARSVAFLPKPFTHEMLAKKVRSVLDGVEHEDAAPA